jgi:hypothetical protein
MQKRIAERGLVAAMNPIDPLAIGRRLIHGAPVLHGGRFESRPAIHRLLPVTERRTAGVI